MFLNEQQTYYDLLEISPQASESEIKTAYMRMKNAYSKDSAATYSLVSSEDVEFLMSRLEEAFAILTSPEKRRVYDMNTGIIPKTDEGFFGGDHKVVSIDRVPPMEASRDTEELLIAPITHFEPDLPPPVEAASTTSPEATATPPPYENKPEKHQYSVLDIANFQLELDRENEWTGSFLRKTRETLGVSIDELATFSRVNKSYLVAIEEDIYKKLPAPVFLRGFLMQICKKLKLPHDRVVSAYLDRYKSVCPEKF